MSITRRSFLQALLVIPVVAAIPTTVAVVRKGGAGFVDAGGCDADTILRSGVIGRYEGFTFYETSYGIVEEYRADYATTYVMKAHPTNGKSKAVSVPLHRNAKLRLDQRKNMRIKLARLARRNA